MAISKDSFGVRQIKILIEQNGKKETFIDYTLEANSELTSKHILRITFLASFSVVESYSRCDLAIYNLAKNSVGDFIGKKIEVWASKDGEPLGCVYAGSIYNIAFEREGTDTVHRIYCGNLGQNNRPKMQKTLGKGSTVIQFFKEVANHLKLPLDCQEEQFANDQKFLRGLTLAGDPVWILDAYKEQYGYEWNIENDRLYINKTKSNRNGYTYEINIKTGMIGIPEIDSDSVGIYCNFETRLDTRLRCGSNVHVKSSYVTFTGGNVYILPKTFSGGKYEGGLDGKFVVQELTLEGDTWGQNWKTKVKGRANG